MLEYFSIGVIRKTIWEKHMRSAFNNCKTIWNYEVTTATATFCGSLAIHRAAVIRLHLKQNLYKGLLADCTLRVIKKVP